MSRSDEAEGGGQGERQKKKQTIPHLINLNEDPQLSRVIVHFLEQGTNRIDGHVFLYRSSAFCNLIVVFFVAASCLLENWLPLCHLLLFFLFQVSL